MSDPRAYLTQVNSPDHWSLYKIGSAATVVTTVPGHFRLEATLHR